MILRIAFGEATVYYEDNARKGAVPTPEHVEDLLIRMERTLNRIWLGNAPEHVHLVEMEE